MFKQNPNRPPIIIQLKKITNGFKVIPNDTQQLFTIRKIVRSMYRSQTVSQSVSGINNAGNSMLPANHTMHISSHITIPKFSKWFSLDEIHELQIDQFPEFFIPFKQSKQLTFSRKNSHFYMYLRNTIIAMWRQNSQKYLSPALCRRILPGDVSSIMRIHGFLQNWGLINFPSKDHNNKGKLKIKPHKFDCYICQESQSENYYLTEIETIIFQICDICYQNNRYPQIIEKQQFIKISISQYKKTNQNLMQQQELQKMLEILNNNNINNNNINKQKQKQIWLLLQKQFINYSKNQIMMNFLKLPKNLLINTSFMQNQQFIKPQQIQIPKYNPSIFEDYMNPIQTSIVIAYFRWKSNPIQQQKINIIMQDALKNTQILKYQQQNQIQQLMKMIVQFALSKVQLKSLFIQQYNKLVISQQNSCLNLTMNNMAQLLKSKLRQVQLQTKPEHIYPQIHFFNNYHQQAQ